MNRLSQTEKIRSLVKERLNHRGASKESEIRETILIQSGNYCGRRYQLDGFQAVWFAEENQIKIYHEDGTLLEVVVPETISSDNQQKVA